MSFLLSFKAAKCTLGNSSVKAVLRCLCDYANDDGSNCRPSTETIALETECDRRTVFKAVSFLATNGWIKVFSKGRGARNFYAINVEKIETVYQQSRGIVEQVKFESSDKNVTTSSSNNVTSDKNDTSYKNAPRVVSILSESGDKNVTQLSQYSVNTQSYIYTNEKNDSLKNSEPVEDELHLVEASEVVETEPTSSKPKKSKTNVTKPDDVSDDLWADFLNHRKQKKAPVTDRVISLIRNEAKNAGWTLKEALNEVILRNWTGFKADWVKDEWKDPNAHWISAAEYNKELPPVTYSTSAKNKFAEKLHAGMRAYDIKDLPNNKEQK